MARNAIRANSANDARKKPAKPLRQDQIGVRCSYTTRDAKGRIVPLRADQVKMRVRWPK